MWWLQGSRFLCCEDVEPATAVGGGGSVAVAERADAETPAGEGQEEAQPADTAEGQTDSAGGVEAGDVGEDSAQQLSRAQKELKRLKGEGSGSRVQGSATAQKTKAPAEAGDDATGPEDLTVDGDGLATYKGVPMEASLARYLAGQEATLSETRQLLTDLKAEREAELQERHLAAMEAAETAAMDHADRILVGFREKALPLASADADLGDLVDDTLLTQAHRILDDLAVAPEDLTTDLLVRIGNTVLPRLRRLIGAAVREQQQDNDTYRQAHPAKSGRASGVPAPKGWREMTEEERIAYLEERSQFHGGGK